MLNLAKLCFQMNIFRTIETKCELSSGPASTTDLKYINKNIINKYISFKFSQIHNLHKRILGKYFHKKRTKNS